MNKKKLQEAIDTAIYMLQNSTSSLVQPLSAGIVIARAKGDKDYERWFNAELNGYRHSPFDQSQTCLGDFLGVDEPSDIPKRIIGYRLVKGHFLIETQRGVAKYPWPLFLSQAIPEIEYQYKQAIGNQLRLHVDILPDSMPPNYKAALEKYGLGGQMVTIYLKPVDFFGILSSFRSELHTYLMSLSLTMEPINDVDKEEKQTSINIGSIKGGTVNNIVMGSHSVINLGGSLPAEQNKTQDILKQLREEVLGLQDLLIGSRKDHLAFEESQEEIKTTLMEIISHVESRLPTNIDSVSQVRQIAEAVLGEMVTKDEVDKNILRKIAGHGVSHSLLASAIVEAIKVVILNLV